MSDLPVFEQLRWVENPLVVFSFKPLKNEFLLLHLLSDSILFGSGLRGGFVFGWETGGYSSWTSR